MENLSAQGIFGKPAAMNSHRGQRSRTLSSYSRPASCDSRLFVRLATQFRGSDLQM
jgi:hypothetical protein